MPDKPWMDHYPAEVVTDIDYPEHNLARLFVDTAQRYPRHDALEFMGRTMSYAALLGETYRFANALVGLGIRKGDRVAIMLPNCPQCVFAYYGTLLTGAVAVMTNPLYTPRELEHQLKDAEARLIVTLDVFVGRVRQATKDAPLAYTLVTSIKDYLPSVKKWLYPLKTRKDGQMAVGYDDRTLPLARLLQQAADSPLEAEVDARRDAALIQYTGGTTGYAKGVVLTHHNLVVNTLQCRSWFYRCELGKERLLAVLPFFHVFGMTVLLNLSSAIAGTLILVPRFEIAGLLRTIDRRKPTMFPGAPTMYIAIINHPRLKQYDLSSIRVCISGAAPLPVEVQERFEALTGGKLIEGYGLTEASPVTHANPVWGRRKIGSIGTPLPDTEARIVNADTGEALPAGELGELAIRGPQVMQAYWRQPEETARTLRDGWLLTGDLGRMDEDGFFYITDRRKDLIIAGGYNVYPREVEEVLFEHPDIVEAAVAGVPDAYRGETVKAYVVLRAGCKPDPAALGRWCRERLAAYKVPRIFEYRDALPKTLVGKVFKRKLLEEEAERRGRT